MTRHKIKLKVDLPEKTKCNGNQVESGKRKNLVKFNLEDEIELNGRIKLVLKERSIKKFDKVTVCKVDAWLELPENMYKTSIRYDDNLNACFSFTGYSRCREGDNYDEVIGEKIARTRAKNKAYNYFEKRLTKYLESLCNNVGYISEFVTQSQWLINHNNEYVENLISSNSNE